jgi:alkanesulfonate monooxygenase SsuD/methylene tetrahydromethanopterin reductase-like flavin-dependent oxidoreductase (luciferase family)
VTSPLAAGGTSLRIYPHDLPPALAAAEVVAQAQLAEAVGFDGVLLSEHHGGFPNYLPNPLLAANWILAATSRLWAAPCPTLLPLRPVTQVIEDLAWTAARFPGRIGAGFAVGAHELDFSLAGVPFADAVDRFKAALPEAARFLSGGGDGPLASDPSVAAASIPMVSAAQSPAAARRAAGLGLGLLFDSLISVARAGEVVAAHRAAGGTAACVLVRRVWIGAPPGEAVAAQMDRFRFAASEAAQRGWAPDGGLIAADDPAEVVERLRAAVAESGCDALDLRVFHAGVSPDDARAQIERIGTHVLPGLWP